jgi:hypothetical protein
LKRRDLGWQIIEGSLGGALPDWEHKNVDSPLIGCGSGDLLVESHDQVFSNGLERSNMLGLGGNAAGWASLGQLRLPSHWW